MFAPPDIHKYVETPVHQLKAGDYVAFLDKPWIDTPFAMQGLHVRSDEDIVALAEHCDHVYVDPRRIERQAYPTRNPLPPPKRGISMRVEFTKAEADYESARDAVSRVFNKFRADGALNIRAVADAITPLIDHVVNHKEAMAALARMKKKDDYLYSHSLAVCVWAIVLGQHIGLDKQELKILALGSSLIDVGKVKLPKSMLTGAGPLSDEELVQARKHVEVGVAILSRDEDIDQRVIDIVASHHERHDGSGYPQGLKGEDISLNARIAGLTDTYDAMITPRPYAAARSSYDVVRELLTLSGRTFSEALVEQFVQTVGMFPTGSIVELNSGEVGIVVAQNGARRLKPQIVVILDPNKQAYPELYRVDLMKRTADRSDEPLWIVQELQVGAHGINPRDFYLSID